MAHDHIDGRREWDIPTTTKMRQGVISERISSPNSDVRSTEEYTYVSPHASKAHKKIKQFNEEEPLVDTTASLPLRSKKTGRLQKQKERKQKKAAARPQIASLLSLPAELLQEIIGYLKPTDILRFQRTTRSLYEFVSENENPIAKDIIRRRYSILAQCFPLPIFLEEVDRDARPALLSKKRQGMLNIHRKGYQHVMGIDPCKVCSCMSCLLAWNNLNMIVDLSHWQKNLDNREPIPMIPRGRLPEWNTTLVASNAAKVEKSMSSPLTYALILETHLQATVGTIMRTFRGKKPVHPNRLYHLTQAEAAMGTDVFLSRSGPESHEFPYHRDNYYNLEAYVPNRKWSKEHSKWIYYAAGLHERDLQWVKERFTPIVLEMDGLQDPMASFKRPQDIGT